MVVDNDACHDNCLNIPDINGLDSSVERIEFITGLYNLAFEEIRYTDSTQLTAFKESVLKVLHNPDMKKPLEDFINLVISYPERRCNLLIYLPVQGMRSY
jgi:hypothetical protein